MTVIQKRRLRLPAFALATTLLVGALPVTAQTLTLATTAGTIVIALDAERAPKSVANVVAYAKAGHYDGTVFHRVIPDFMIQGGGFTPDMRQKPTRPPIALESRNGLSNVRGAVALARTSVPDSATSQFYINVKDNTFLDAANAPDGHGYAVFGKVVRGMDVVDKIRSVATGSRAGYPNVPLEPVIIQKATLED